MTTIVNEAQVAEVVEAVRAIYDPATPNDRRLFFTKGIEDLKERLAPSEAISLAFQLTQYNGTVVKHLGWNMIEHVIRYNWPSLDHELKTSIKNRIMADALSGRYSLFHGPDSQIKVAICRCVVYLVENDWPQRWPDLLPQLRNVLEQSYTGDPRTYSQCEMVFMILERLVEEVQTMSTMADDSPRHKELQNSLKTSVKAIIEMTVERLQLCSAELSSSMVQANGISPPSQSTNEIAPLLARVGIELLSSIVEWGAVNVLEECCPTLVQVLSPYLQIHSHGVCIETAKCLRGLVSRRITAKDRETALVMAMLSNTAMEDLLKAISTATNSISQLEQYPYLRALCDYVAALGQHIADIWPHLHSGDTAHTNFSHFLSMIVTLFMHPALYIRSESAHVLATISSNPAIASNGLFAACLTSTVFPNILRFMVRSEMVAASRAFYTVKMDPDEEEKDQQRDYLALRERCCRIVRESTKQHSQIFLSIVDEWLRTRFLVCADTVGPDEWDAMKRFLTTLIFAVYNTQPGNTVTPEKQAFVSMFDIVLGRIHSFAQERSQAVVGNNSLSILSALFLIFSHQPDRIPMLLAELKTMLLVENPNNEDINLLSLKRHCITLLLKLVSSSPEPTKPYAKLIVSLAVEVNSRLSDMQRANLVGMLGALSNLASSAEEQQLFLREAIQHNVEYFAGVEFQEATKSPQGLLSYIGLQSEVPKNDVESLGSVHYRNRLNMKSHLTAIDGVIQQVDISANDSNPLFPLLAPIIPSLFLLAKSINCLYEPEIATTAIHPSYGSKGEVLEMSSSDRQAVIRTVLADAGGAREEVAKEEDADDGLSPSPSKNNLAGGAPAISPVVRLRSFVSEITELVQNILGSVGSKLHREFYSPAYKLSVDVAQLLLHTVASAERVPDYRLRFWIRRTWTKLIYNCPPESAQLVAPLVREYTRHLQSLLSDRWTRELSKENGEDASDPTEEEIISEALLCMISREHGALLKSMIVSEATNKGGKNPGPNETLTELGRQLLSDREILQYVVATLGQLVGCPDTQSALRCVPTLGVIVSNFSASPLFEEQMAAYLLIHSIRSLQLNGSDDMICSPLLSLVFQLYYHLRPIHPSLLEIIRQVPDLPADALQRFDERVMSIAQKGEGGSISEKQKRDLIRKVLKTVIGTPTSGLFKRPSVYLKSKRRPSAAEPQPN